MTPEQEKALHDALDRRAGQLATQRTHRTNEALAGGGHDRLGPSSWQSRSISALALRRWKCAWSLLLSHHRLDRYCLVALTRLWVLFDHARELSFDANRVPNNPAVLSLAL
jgi:hypothetical protein